MSKMLLYSLQCHNIHIYNYTLALTKSFAQTVFIAVGLREWEYSVSTFLLIIFEQLAIN